MNCVKDTKCWSHQGFRSLLVIRNLVWSSETQTTVFSHEHRTMQTLLNNLPLTSVFKSLVLLRDPKKYF